MTETLDAIRQVSALLSRVARVDRTALGDDELVQLLVAEETAGRLLDAARVLTAGEVADRSRFELGDGGLSMRHGHRKPVHLIEQATRVSQAEAFRRIRVGLAIRPRRGLTGGDLPAERATVAEGMILGTLGIDSAAAIIGCLKQAASGTEALPDRMAAAERALDELGARESADLVWDAGRAWRDALDPDGVEPRYEDILARRGLTVGRERNGITDIHLKADPISAALIKTAIADSTTPGAVPRFLGQESLNDGSLDEGFLNEGDAARGTRLVGSEGGEPTEALVDPRTREARQFDAFLGVLEAGIRAAHEGPASLRTTGTVVATIPLAELQCEGLRRDELQRDDLLSHHTGKVAGRLEGSDEPLPLSAIKEMICDTGFQKLVLGTRGEPLFLGTRERFFTQAQRRAICVRDGDRCLAPGCRTSASGCHAHHVIFSMNGGGTNVDNGVMLCSAHHHALHAGAFEITMIDGMPHLRGRMDSDDETAWKPAGRRRLLAATAA